MNSRTKIGIWILFIMVVMVVLAKFSGVSASKTYRFDFSKGFALEATNNNLKRIVESNLEGVEGSFAVVIENMGGEEKYGLFPDEEFPAASLYKLVLLSAVLKEVENGGLKMEEKISASKSHLTDVLGSVDFGYEDVSGEIRYTVEEALTRVGRISDNFAAIMLTERLRELCKARPCGARPGLADLVGDPLVDMAAELGMKDTNLNPKGDEFIMTTASDVALFFRKLYRGEVVSKTVSDEIIGLLSLSKINDRIPAGLPKGVTVVHKTGELSRIRHDGGIVYLDEESKDASGSAEPKRAYLIVLLSKDLKYEDKAVEAMVRVSKEVWEYFSKKE